MLDARRIPLASKIIVTWSKSRPRIRRPDARCDRGKTRLRPDRGRAKRLLPAGAIYFMMSEDDVRRVLSYPHTMIGSDGLPHDQHPHPRLWGTFPRVLGHYVRDVKLFPLEEAVRRMTALPAAQFGLKDRGVLRAGACADLVLFDPRHDRGHGDLRTAEDAGRRHRLGDGQRPHGVERRRCNRRPPGPRVAAEHARPDGRRHGGALNAAAAMA